MQLVIAEKPSVARDLARVLGVRGAGRHAITDAGRVITWCIGHLVELDEPAAYDARWKAWRMDALPMIPTAFKLRPVDGTRDQLNAVRELLRDRRFTEVVNACDSGREGELIFRYVYEICGSRLPVRRLWISSMTDDAIERGFARLKPGVEYDALGDAARCRSEADWLVGMNATRAVTVTRRNGAPAPATTPAPRPPSGGGGRGGGAPRSPVYSIGRVQTPTLAIVVKREQAILAFRPRDYWEVRATFTTAGDTARASFTAGWGARPPRGNGGNAGPGRGAVVTRLGTAELGAEILARARAHAAATDAAGPVVESVRGKKTREPAPQLFDLTSLQRTANRRFGLSATRTLEAAQALYERHKILTYPRTDSRHLSGDLFDELPKLFRGLSAIPDYEPFARTLLAGPPARSKRVFDDSKIHDHHAIIPTGKAVRLDALDVQERRVFDLVVRRFLGVFYPDAEFALTDAVIRVGAGDAAAPEEPAVAARAPATATTTSPATDGAPAADETILGVAPPPPDRFRARGRVRLVAGWQEVAQIGEARRGEGTREGRGAPDGKDRDADADTASLLPPLAEGQRLDGAFESLAKQTKPPPRHTEATLLGAMESAGRDIEDEALRAAMKDTGLGTPATRAATIETLVRRDFITRHGKDIVPTPVGIGLIEGLPVASLASPELTGSWEARLAHMARGGETRAAFMSDIAAYVSDVVDAIRRAGTERDSASAARPARAANGAAQNRAVTPRPSPTPLPASRGEGEGRGARVRANAPATARVTAGAKAAPTTLTCPRCKQGPLVAGKRGWGCSRWREGCAFVVWFETAGRRLSDTQLGDLITKGKTRKTDWNPPGGPARPGRLVLDSAAPAASGAARFEPA